MGMGYTTTEFGDNTFVEVIGDEVNQLLKKVSEIEDKLRAKGVNVLSMRLDTRYKKLSGLVGNVRDTANFNDL